METHNLDSQKLEACIKLGRRFYVVSKLLIKYIDVFLEEPDSCKNHHINFLYNFEDVLLILSKERRTGFSPFSINVPEKKNCKWVETYRLFNNHVFINFLVNMKSQDFNAVYHSDIYPYEYKSTIFKKFKDIHIKQVPIEVNLTDSTIKSDDKQILFSHRRALIELLYFSSSVFNFFNRFINYLLASTQFYHGSMYNYLMMVNDDTRLMVNDDTRVSVPFYTENRLHHNQTGIKLMKIFYGDEYDENFGSVSSGTVSIS